MVAFAYCRIMGNSKAAGKNIRINITKKKLLEFQRTMLNWYAKNGRSFPWRNKSSSKYKLVIAEFLLQRTKAETVAAFFNTFISQYSSWKKLAEAPEVVIGEAIQPIGLWRRRASTLKRIGTAMHKRSGRFPRTRREIEALPGVGQYIANAIEVFCSNKRRPLLDVNMARVLERFFGPRKLADIRYDPYLQKLAHDVLPRKKIKEFNWAILDFGALVCKARSPACNNCPLAKKCKFP